MAVPPSTFETVDSIGNREDLSDIIYALSPTDTPFLSMAGRGTVKSTKHEWQVDILANPGTNAVAEGDDATIEAATPTERVFNYTQISDKALIISGTLETIDKAGRDSELSYQLAKKSKELKRDLEHQCVGQTGAARTAVAGSSGVARVSASVASFFNDDLASTSGGTALPGTHESRGATGASTGWGAAGPFTMPTDGTQRALTESMLKAVVQGAWTNGGNPTTVMCGPFNKRVISQFTGGSTRMDKGEDKRLTAAIDVYASDFGEHRIVPNRFQAGRDVYCFTPELWSVDYLRPFRQHALSKTGDNEKRQLLVEWTLVGKNQSGSGVIADLTTS